MHEGVFVGRTTELALLQAALERIRDGQPRVVLVSGPAGIGKTALVRKFVRDAGPVTVLRASGDELESGLDFGIFEQLVRGFDVEQPDVADTLTLGASLVELLRALQAVEPVIVLVDDAHWADRPSLQALAFALRRLRDERVLCVIVARADAWTVPGALRRLTDSDGGLAVRLGGLDGAALATLAATMGWRALDRRAAERLREHTGGNPLYARALLEQLDPETLWRGKGPLPAPSSFATLVLSRLASCSREAARLVTAAAVLGRRCLLGTAAEVAELEDPLGALEEAVRARLVEAPHASGVQSVVFPHPLVRAAVYHDLGPAQRARLHARAAELLDSPASLEHRVAAAVVPDAPLSAQLEAYASGEEARGAFASAAAHLESAATLSTCAATRERLLLRAVELLLRNEDVVAAGARAGQVSRMAESPRSLAVLGHLALARGRHGEAERLLSAAFQGCEPDREPDVAATASVHLARVCLAEARSAEAITWAMRASDIEAGDPFVSELAFGLLVLALGLSGQAPEALALVAALPEQAHELRLDHVAGVTMRGIVRLWADDVAGARADLAAVTSTPCSQRLSRLRVAGLGCLAAAEYSLGAWDDSLTHAATAVSLAEATDHCCPTAIGDIVSAWILAARGEQATAEAHVQAAMNATGSRSALGIAGTANASALVAYARGNHAAVVRAVQPIVALRHRDGIDEPGVFSWREHYADALTSLGRLDEAEAVLVPLEALASERGHRSAMANAARVRGNLDAARGKLDLARTAFGAGLDHLGGLQRPLDRARLHHAYGQLLRRAGERGAAARELTAAHELYTALGARPFVERCERELAACGLSPARRSPGNRLDLTPQERTVARLVATGLTNRQVAAKLVISAKTVEYHLGNVYAKLGLRSRTQLAIYLNGNG